jgi:hypothetical protein
MLIFRQRGPLLWHTSGYRGSRCPTPLLPLLLNTYSHISHNLQQQLPTHQAIFTHSLTYSITCCEEKWLLLLTLAETWVGLITCWRCADSLTHSITPSLHHSITPSLHHSITPSLHHSITPSLIHSFTHSLTPSLPTPSLPPSLHHSLTPSLPHLHVLPVRPVQRLLRHVS